jgi:ribosome biogenesis GTPase
MPSPNESGRGKRGRKVRVDFRRNRQDRRRQKSIPPHLAEQIDDLDKLATPAWETVAPKGDLSRKRTVIEQEGGAGPLLAGALDGLVTAVRGLIADVEGPDGVSYACTVRRVLRTRCIDQRHPVTVGDRVRFVLGRVRGDAPPEGVISEVLPRRSELCRANEKRTHLIAANVDQLIVVASVDCPPLKPSLIDRYLISASAGRMAGVVCLNKIDLDVDGAALDVLDRYRRIGYPTIATSTTDGRGIDELRAVLKDKSSVLAGQSGVGKSSLLNAVQPGLRLRTGDVSIETGKGRHTTTTAQLLKLDAGGYVVDTPGIRAFELAMVPLNELETHFAEFVPLIPRCRFGDCTHIHEDGCAVLAALAAGEIHPDRHATYVRVFKERCGLMPLEFYEDEDYTRR